MKLYIVFDGFGNDIGYISAGSQAAAEVKAKKMFAKTVPHPENITVAYTEV